MKRIPDLKFLLKNKKIVLIEKKTILTIFLIVFIIEGFLFLKIFQIIPYDRILANIMPSFLVDLTNEERNSMDLGHLRVNSVLEEAASLKAQDMAKKGYFSHNCPDGITPWHWFKEAGYDFSYAGENLAVNFIDSNLLHQAWLDSAKHRENILNKNFTEIGIATAEGVYKGRNAIFVVQLFGRPRIVPVLAEQPKQIEYQPEEQPKEPEQPKDPEKIETEESILLVEEQEPASPIEVEETIIESPVVLGQEEPNNLEIIEERDSFIAVKSLEQDLDQELAPFAEEIDIKYSTIMARTLSSPKQNINFILASLVGLFAFLGIFGAIKKPRMNTYSLVINSFIVLFILGSSIYANHFIFSLFGSVL